MRDKRGYFLKTFWTEERNAELTRLIDNGASSGEAAHALGTSRNSVIGRAGRMGLKLQGSPGGSPAQKSQRAMFGVPKRKPQPGSNTNRVRAVKARADVPRPPRYTPTARVEDVAQARPLGERKAWQCSWIVSADGEEPMQCCAPIVCLSWCATHAAIGFQPPNSKSGRNLERTFKRYV